MLCHLERCGEQPMIDKLSATLNDYLPLRDVVFNTLRQAILMGELEPGARLMEIQLANRLGVSRTPIREAIRKLELEGLVVMIPRKGAEVAKITSKDLHDVLEVRCALEELAVELACNKISAEDIAALKETLEAFKTALNNKVLADIAATDVYFHDIIYTATHNDRLIQMLSNLREQMYRYRVEYLKDSQSHSKLIEEHEAIIYNLQTRNVSETKRIIKNHIYNQATTVSRNIKEENK